MAKLKIKLTKKGRDSLKLLKELPKRQERLRKYAAFKLAESVKEEVVSRIPKEFPEYANSVKIAGVDDSDGFVVFVDSDGKSKGKEDSSDILIVVRARRYMIKADESAVLLEKLGPWTEDTLPFIPSPKIATISRFKVSSAKAKRVSQIRRAAYPLIRRRFAALGVRLSPFRKGVALSGGDGILDAALVLEFGVGRGSKPHWGIGVRAALRNFPRKMSMDANTVSTFTNLKYTGWKNWSFPFRKISDAERFDVFQEKLGL